MEVEAWVEERRRRGDVEGGVMEVEAWVEERRRRGDVEGGVMEAERCWD
jgi:hypothetical protein